MRRSLVSCHNRRARQGDEFSRFDSRVPVRDDLLECSSQKYPCLTSPSQGVVNLDVTQHGDSFLCDDQSILPPAETSFVERGVTSVLKSTRVVFRGQPYARGIWPGSAIAAGSQNIKVGDSWKGSGSVKHRYGHFRIRISKLHGGWLPCGPRLRQMFRQGLILSSTLLGGRFLKTSVALQRDWAAQRSIGAENAGHHLYNTARCRRCPPEYHRFDGQVRVGIRN